MRSNTNPQRFKIVTLGCRTNQYESEAYAHQLLQLGCKEAGEGELADVCIVNTCTVTASADNHSRHQIRQLARLYPGAQLMVTGCLAERAHEEIAALAGVTHVVGNQQKEKLLQNLFPEQELPEFVIENFAAHTRAFVKVQDGCNSFCTYCVIPYVRGRSRSRSVESIVGEVEGLVENGYQEVVLTGINIGDFDGGGTGERLAHLVRAVDRVVGLKRLRLSSIDPDEVDEGLMEAIMEGRSTCPSLHIVLQSGSNVILKKMNRKYTRQIFLGAVERLRAANPDFTFTTDVIVGFPGETESDFAETIAVMEQVGFCKVHMFPYSRRERTRAALYPNTVAPAELQRRKALTLRRAEEIAFAMRAQYVGRRMEVLIENSEQGSFGHTANFLPVVLRDVKLAANTRVEIDLIANAPEGLIGALA